MKLEDAAVEARTALGVLSEYSMSRLKSASIDPLSLDLRDRYVYGIFLTSQSLTDGICVLSERWQLFDMSVLLRVLQEAWVKSLFIYTGESHVWAYYLILGSEYETLKTLEKLLESGDAEQSAYDDKLQSYTDLVQEYGEKFPTIPSVPEVFTKKRDRDFGKMVESRLVGIKGMCKVIDHYSASNSMVKNYDIVYKELSQFTHVNPRGMSAFFYETVNSRGIDISGGLDMRKRIIITVYTFLYHCEMLENFNTSIVGDVEELPDKIKKLKERMIKLSKVAALKKEADTNNTSRSQQ